MKARESLPVCENCAKALATRVRNLNESCTNIPHAAWEIVILISRWVDTYHTIHDERSIKQPITIMIPCNWSEKRILRLHFRMALFLTSEMVSQVIISIFRCSLGKLKWKFPSHAERWWTNQATMAMRKSLCKNTSQYLRSCCSPIGQNNKKDFSATLHFLARFISSRPSQPPLGHRGWVPSLRGCPRYGASHCKLLIIVLVFLSISKL